MAYNCTSALALPTSALSASVAAEAVAFSQVPGSSQDLSQYLTVMSLGLEKVTCVFCKVSCA